MNHAISVLFHIFEYENHPTMKKLLTILTFYLPLVVFSQQSWYKSSPLDYMWMNVGDPNLSYGSVYWTSVAFNPANGQPYVAYNDFFYNDAPSVKTYDGMSWQYVGDPGFSGGSAGLCGSLAISPSGQPYIAFNDGQFLTNGRLTVMNFNGGIWDTVGHSGFSSGELWDVSLAFSSSGEPYVAYSDIGILWKTTVMKFDGTSWVTVGSPGFSAGATTYNSLAFSPSDQPFVGFKDFGNSRKATVMKFDGTTWVNVGNTGFSSSVVDFTSLAFSPTGEPYLAFSDSALSRKTTVMKFDGINWVNVGNAGFSNGRADYQSLAFGPLGEPFVAFQDFSLVEQASVMKFNGTDWVNVGDPFSGIPAFYESLKFSLVGVPYVAYIENYGVGGVTVMKYDSVLVGINNYVKNPLVLYPNPASNEIIIDSRDDENDLKNIEIYDMRGEIVSKSITNKGKITLDVKDFPKGIYVVKSRSESSNYIGKFCKN
jgi:hypothetical protein